MSKITRSFLNVTEVPMMALVRSANISLNPFDSRSKRAKTVIRYLLSRNIKLQNPKYTVTTKLHDLNSSPLLEMTYLDDSKKLFDLNQPIDSLLLAIHKYNLALDKKGVQLPSTDE